MSDNWAFYSEKLSQKIQDIQEKFKIKLKKVYTSRLHPDILGELPVEAYGEHTTLKAVANIQLATAYSFVIKPYDPSLADAIDKSIKKNRENCNSVVKGDSVNVSFPAPTQESREKAVKETKQFLEDAKIDIRNARHQVLNDIKKEELPKDLEKKFIENLEKAIKETVADFEHLFEKKKVDLMTI